MVFAIMKEMNKNTRFIAKNDIVQMVRNKMTEKDVDRVLNQLCEDGTIHSGYDDNVFSITEWDVVTLIWSVLNSLTIHLLKLKR